MYTILKIRHSSWFQLGTEFSSVAHDVVRGYRLFISQMGCILEDPKWFTNIVLAEIAEVKDSLRAVDLIACMHFLVSTVSGPSGFLFSSSRLQKSDKRKRGGRSYQASKAWTHIISSVFYWSYSHSICTDLREGHTEDPISLSWEQNEQTYIIYHKSLL